MEKCVAARLATYHNLIWRKHFACWITKVTNTHSEYVVLIDFTCQKGLGKCDPMLHCTNIACRSIEWPEEQEVNL